MGSLKATKEKAQLPSGFPSPQTMRTGQNHYLHHSTNGGLKRGPVQGDLPGFAGIHDLETLEVIVDSQTMGDHRPHIASAPQHAPHLVPRFEHLPAAAAPDH